MVGPSTTDEDRERFLRQFRVGVALLVGASMALVSLYGSASLPLIAGAAAGGTAAGALLAWWVFPARMILGYDQRR